MELIESLSHFQPLYDRSEMYTKWINVNDYRRFVLVFGGDTMINVEVQWTCDDASEQKAVMFTNLCASASDHYKYSCEKVKLIYCRLKITNKTGQRSERFVLYFYGMEKVKQEKKLTFTEPLPNLKNSIVSEPFESPRSFDIKDSPKSGRFKSPFKKSTDRKSSLSTPPQKRLPIRDERLPEVALPGALLVGQKGGTWGQVPLGLPDQVLKVGAGKLEYAFPYPSDHNPEWKLKE